MVISYIILLAALYLIFIAWLFNTSTVIQFISFKLLPFILSIILAAHAIKQLGWLALL